MALPLPPASNLHAILLVTKSRSLGPRLVFHYPPLSPSAASLVANTNPRWFSNETSTGSIDSQSSGSDWDSSTEHDGDDDAEVWSRASGRGSGRAGGSLTSFKPRPGPGGNWGRQDTIDEDDADEMDDDRNGDGFGKGHGHGKEISADYDWNTVLGFKVDALEKMLCPSKVFNKRRFELGVESIVFVGAPMFVRDDGGWKKGRRWERKKSKVTLEDGQQAADKLSGLKMGEDEGVDVDDADVQEPFVYPEGFEPGYGHGLMSGAASGAVSEAGSDTRTASTTDNGPDMTMFNVVFVLNPPTLEYQLRVKEMYENVTRKYAKALKYEQARYNYVWKETKKILNIKQRAKENGESLSLTWREIIHSSPLAKSIAIMFDAISQDKIAHVHFDATFDTSFQIPQPVSTPYLPNALEPQMPGLWLTTANVVIEEDNDAPLTQHSALLLLEDTETLVKELESDAKENATPLAFYIRNITPTKSLQKISIKHSIPAQDIEYIAGHLVYWRRARLIPPLHPRDTYIVSPNADMSQLKAAIPAYAARFPTYSSLPKILSMLSGVPRPYRSIIPSTEHREAYMEILAWLMRGGWVTQLRTFAWVRVTAEIKAEVAAEMEREAHLKKAEEERRREAEDNESYATESAFSDHTKRSSYLSLQSLNRPGTPMRRTQRRETPHQSSAHSLNVDDEVMDASTILSPRAHPYRGSPARPSSDAGSTSSNRTTIPVGASQTHHHHHHHRPASPQPLTRPQRPSSLHLNKLATVYNPSNASRPSSRQSQNVSSPPLPLSPNTQHHPHYPYPQVQSHIQPTKPPHTQQTLSPKPSPHANLASSFAPSIIPSPLRASALEARWLEKISQTFADPELRDVAWPMLLKHFDGKHALDDIAVRECMKQKKVAGWVSGVRDAGWLVLARHW